MRVFYWIEIVPLGIPSSTDLKHIVFVVCFEGLCCPNENHLLSFFDHLPSWAPPFHLPIRFISPPHLAVKKHNLNNTFKNRQFFFFLVGAGGGADLSEFSLNMPHVKFKWKIEIGIFTEECLPHHGFPSQVQPADPKQGHGQVLVVLSGKIGYHFGLERCI